MDRLGCIQRFFRVPDRNTNILHLRIFCSPVPANAKETYKMFDGAGGPLSGAPSIKDCLLARGAHETQVHTDGL